jgi:hypothetical protein
MNPAKSLLALCVLLACSTVLAAEYHVAVRAADASDDNPGAADKPWRTLAKAAATAQAGDVVFHKSLFDELVTRLGPLNYHRIFILEPWLILGGVNKPETYGSGDCGTYLDLVAQTMRQVCPPTEDVP